MPGDFPAPLVPEDDHSVVVEGSGTVTIPDQTAPVNDTWTVRLVVLFLGAVVVAIIVGATVLELNDHSMPDQIVGLALTAIGGLVGLLASTASKRT